MGADAARKLADDGFKVGILSSSGKGEALGGELGGFGVTGSNLDGEALNALVEGAKERWGRIDVLVNSAGHGPKGPVLEISDDDWHQGMEVYLMNVIRPTKLVTPTMLAQGNGSIINISSIYGVVGNDPTIYLDTDMKQPATYTFVKAGMINFTRYLANYYGKQGVRANCISPGGYFNNQPDAFVDEYTRRVPIGRMLDNEDIKGAVVYLASDASEYVNGHNLLVDGGWTAV